MRRNNPDYVKAKYIETEGQRQRLVEQLKAIRRDVIAWRQPAIHSPDYRQAMISCSPATYSYNQSPLTFSLNFYANIKQNPTVGGGVPTHVHNVTVSVRLI